MKNPLDVQHIVGAARGIRIHNAKLVSPNLMLNMLEIFAVRKTSGWVRLRGNSKLTSSYQDDVAYLQECIKHFVLWVVPRFGEPGTDSRLPRYLPSANSWAKLTPPKGVVVDKNGYWGLQCKNRRLYRRITGMPSMSEALMLQSCAAVPKKFSSWSIEKIRQLKFRVDDRVRIEEGTFRNLIGSIVEAVEDRFKVYIQSHDLEELLDPCHLRREFRVGDQVEFEDDSRTKWGWIVQVWDASYGDLVSVAEHGTHEHVSTAPFVTSHQLINIQFEINTDCLQFHEVPFSIAPRQRKPKQHDKSISLNFNKCYVGKTVQIIRGHHKGKTGTIRDAYEDGRCQVELDVIGYSQLVPLTLDDTRIA